MTRCVESCKQKKKINKKGHVNYAIDLPALQTYRRLRCITLLWVKISNADTAHAPSSQCKVNYVQDVDVSHATYSFTYPLTISIRKRAGALEQAEDRSSAAVGMTESMMEQAKEALAGRTGETDDEAD